MKGNRRAKKKKVKPADIEAEFYSGRFVSIVDQYIDVLQPIQVTQAFPYLVGALTFTGRLDEAEALYGRFNKELSNHQSGLCRFFIGVNYCRISKYELALKYLSENLKLTKRHRHDSKFMAITFQGVGFYRYFCGRFKQALSYAKLARSESMKGDFLYGKFLSSDLLGHAQVQTGEISSGLLMLEEARKYSKLLSGGAPDQAIDISMVCYRAQFGRFGSSSIAELSKLLEQVPEDNYSRSAILLELGRQFVLAGQHSASQRALNDACHLIYGAGHRRQSVQLNMRYAYNLMLAGQPHQGLSLLATARSSLDQRVDRALDLQLSGLELKLRTLVGIQGQSDQLQKQIARQTFTNGNAISQRICIRNDEMNALQKIGEDPLGDLLDNITCRPKDSVAEIIKSGYLGLLPSVLPELRYERVLCFGLAPESVLIVDRGDLRLVQRGITGHLRSILQRLSYKQQSKEDLVAEIWGYKYSPIRHDQLVYSAISKLRQLLGSKAHWIEASDKGYHLAPNVRVISRSNDSLAEMKRTSLSQVASEHNVQADLNARQLSALSWIGKNNVLDAAAYRKLFNVSSVTAARDLTQLSSLFLVRRVGRGRATKYLAVRDSVTNEV